MPGSDDTHALSAPPMPALPSAPYDATHSLFVLGRPGRPTRYLFVHEQTGASLLFQVDRDDEAAVVAHHPEGEGVRLVPSRGADSTRVVWRETGGHRAAVELCADGPTLLVRHAWGWVATFESPGRLEIAGPSGGAHVVVRPNTEDLGGESATFDVWATGTDTGLQMAFQAVVEAAVVSRFLSSTAAAPDAASLGTPSPVAL